MEGSSRSEEVKLELRLAPPGEDWCVKNTVNNNNNSKVKMESLSFGYFPSMKNNNTNQSIPPFLQYPSSILPSLSVMGRESPQPSGTNLAENTNTAVPTISQKRTAPASVVGWPPIRSFRKNLASSSSSKQSPKSQENVFPKVDSETRNESCRKGLFVKINMDGIPIGRKVDLNAYDSYEKLSTAVVELFRGLLAVQRDSFAGINQHKHEDKKIFTNVLDGTGEYTLVYEDNEGDRMLVGDVPWHMFVSTAKRLRVLKSSELSSLIFCSNKQGKI